MKRLFAFRRNASGATMVEFALTAPLFIAVLFGIAEAGILLFTQYGLQYGVEAAARCATVDTATCDNAADISTYAANNSLGLSIAPSAFTVTSAPCGNQIQATYAYTFFTGYFGQPSATLTAQSCFPH
jgi:Flp pilus assembly protein TadG